MPESVVVLCLQEGTFFYLFFSLTQLKELVKGAGGKWKVIFINLGISMTLHRSMLVWRTDVTSRAAASGGMLWGNKQLGWADWF